MPDKLTYCPACWAVWSIEEIDEQRCALCDYPDNVRDEAQSKQVDLSQQTFTPCLTQ